MYQVLAVKKINPSLFEGGAPEEFSQIVSKLSKLHHPNIVELVGYCSEQEHMLIYDYFRNGSLHGFLHLSDDFSKPLTWNTRIRIALGTARAIELVYISHILLLYSNSFSSQYQHHIPSYRHASILLICKPEKWSSCSRV